jgi:cephalosporin hydroxylase
MGYTFEGIEILQHPDIQKHFIKILPHFNRIIEIGTYFGALTLFLHRYKRSDCELISYDTDTSLNKIPVKESIDTRQGNYFDEKIVNEIKNLMLDTSKRVLLLCDGGYKEYEFRTFAPFLKPGDVIMVHDYEETQYEFVSIAQLINWEAKPDASYHTLKLDIEKNFLSKYEYYDEFKSVLWGAFIKNIWRGQ